MFAGYGHAGAGDTIRQNESAGLWGVREGTDQYASWAHWYSCEFGKRFFPEWLTVLFEWPPTTQAGADSVASWLSDIRDSKYLKEQIPIGGRPVPRNPRPWAGTKILPRSA